MPNFTSKHYRKLASMLSDLPTTTVRTGPGKLYWDAIHYFNLIDSLCIMFKEDNPNFNRRIFLESVECPYFDEVVMGVPVVNKNCVECNEDFVLYMEDKQDRAVCEKCLRKFHSE